MLDQLDPDQRRAVLADPLPLLVMAGAGSGKTRVLTCRIAHQLRQRIVPPEAVMACTFTKAAAAEMRERVKQLTAGTPAPPVATFHSLMFRLLNSEARIHGAPRLEVCRDSERNRILAGLLSSPSAEFPRAINAEVDVREVGGIISACKNTLIHAGDEWVTAAADEFEATTGKGAAARVYPLYEAHLARIEKLDFDDMLLKAYDLLAGDVGALRRAQRRWLAFFVDEAQDLNDAQWSLLRLIAPADHAPNLTVVGDTKQALYSFRGARPELMEKFERLWPAARRVDLVTNYRSTPQVIGAANRLIASHGHPEQVPIRYHGPVVRAVPFDDDVDQAVEVARFVEAVRAAGHAGSHCAVLVRTNAQTAQIERAMVAARLPYFTGGGGFLNRLEVGDLMAYLRLAHNRAEEPSLRRIINRPTRFLGAAFVDAVAARAETAAEEGDGNVDLVEALRRVRSYSTRQMSSRQVEEACDLAQLLDRIRSLSPATAIRAVLDETDYLDWLRKTEGAESGGGDSDNSGRENIDALIDLASQFTSLADLVGYAEEASRLLRESGDATEICTVHRAKGREWPFVVVANFHQDSFPHKKATDLAEERRIAYVAWTRARDSLLICVPGEDMYGNDVAPSPFLAAGQVEVDEPCDDDWWAEALVPVIERQAMLSGLANMVRSFR